MFSLMCVGILDKSVPFMCIFSVGYAGVIQALDSPSSAEEASFRLGSPVAELQGPSPSEMSPVQIRRPPPVDSELSTPGSGGYASPSVLFAIPPASLMRSSVQNPLYVDRPPSTEGDDNVARVLAMSPRADQSHASRLPRCTFESGWSSSSISAERSISLHASQHEYDDRVSSLPHADPTASPAVSSVRQLIPLMPQVDETPRRIIKNLSATARGSALGADLAKTTCTFSSRMHGAEKGLGGAGLQLPSNSSRRPFKTDEAGMATPCSATFPGRVEREPVPAAAFRSAARNSTATVVHNACDPSIGRKAAQQAGSTKLVNIANVPSNIVSLDRDDTFSAGRALDQTPRKGVRVPAQDGEKHWQNADGRSKEATKAQQRHTAELGMQGGKCSKGTQMLASWLLLSVVLALALLGNHFTAEWWKPPTRVLVAAPYNTGPVCFLERYPGANDLPQAAPSPIRRLPMQLPNCHALDGFLQSFRRAPSLALSSSGEHGPATHFHTNVSGVPSVITCDEDQSGLTLASPPIVAMGNGEALQAILNASDTDDLRVSDKPVLRTFLSARLYGWNLPEFLLGAVTAGFVGKLLAWCVEQLFPCFKRRQKALRRALVQGSTVTSPQSPTVGRILRPKWPQGAAKVDEQVAQVNVAMLTTYESQSIASGSLVWNGNKLVYLEG
ncbi:hypothetical protein VOLCADRAFT_100057 [Volvox carteri f. nagariensis]|uniref:Uncharacterized protein n=1 Tax=Volvox carteri f. nagariensis TaxID=3068 RepID=D8UJB2_VOLCA|nr:uncharacterized protein VOLCADRAFT_100057 [Volvox carteri f. nagariensis]EFJ40192.1 hypothetical protein VOLCADRAFT_100057 [Volvox carteri f. nagariensis]|eukprot:XP_002958736.1 hypothetical protein VOLCADRAFT_100057 [Volvox carteri f. nagariensis]